MNHQSSYHNLYHPIAGIIMLCLNKRINFINRGLFEIKNLQAENFVAEKFAVTTESRLLEGFLRSFFEIQKDVTVCVPTIGPSSQSIKIYKNEKEAKYRLIFKPIDSLNNFTRGLGECGSIFCLQSIVTGDSSRKFEDVFSLFYSFKAQKFLYAEHKGIVYLENKRMKALHRKSSLTVSVNSNAILSGILAPSTLKDAKIKNVFSRGDGLVSDLFDIANGALDGIIYSQIKWWDAIPAQILLSSLSCHSSLNGKIISSEKEEDLNLISGNESVVKAFF